MREFSERSTAAWCSQNAVSVAALYPLTGSLSVNSDAPAEGRKAIARAAQAFMTALPDLQLVMDDLVILGNRAVYHWTLRGTKPGRPEPGARFASAVSK